MLSTRESDPGSDSTRHPGAQRSVAHVVTGVTARVLAQIVLMVRLGAVPGARWLDARRDGPLPLARRIDARLHALRGRPLFGALRKDRRAVLRSDVVALAIERRGIVQL